LNFNDLPNWQKRGIGIYWQDYVKKGFNPVSNQPEKAIRKKLAVELELPMRDSYDKFILELIETQPHHHRLIGGAI
jgi:tRNA(His) 5'-end guanylyltransferase